MNKKKFFRSFYIFFFLTTLTTLTLFFDVFFLTGPACAATTTKKPLVHITAKIAREKFLEKIRPQQQKNVAQDKILSISIPKCGTHLLIKCLALFEAPGIDYKYTQEVIPRPEHLAFIRAKNKQLPPHHYKGLFHVPTVGPIPKVQVARMQRSLTKKSFWNHWPYTQQFEEFLNTHTYANFLIIRDPRDMVVSFAKMVYKSREGQEALLENVITDLITGNKKHYLPWAVEIQEAYPLLWDAGLYNFYKLYLPWAQAKNFMLVKFEDLIGPGGGGTAEKQLKTITKLAQHLKINLTPKKHQEISQNIFGGTWTFREGQIGGWKKYFTPEIKATFKQDVRLNQLLIDLGYEQDTNW